MNGFSRMMLTPILVILVACSDFSTEETSATIQRFHDLYNAENWDQLYLEISEGFRESTERERFDQFMSAIYDKMGPFEEGASYNFNASWVNGTTTADLAYSSKFANGSAQESFKLISEDDVWKVHYFNINSEVFLLAPQANPNPAEDDANTDDTVSF